MENLNIEKLDSEIMPFINNKDVLNKLNDEKISQPYLTKYEYAKIIGIAAQQIESGRKPLVKPPASYIHPIDIAEYELKQKKTPIIIKRKLPNNLYEYFTLEQLII